MFYNNVLRQWQFNHYQFLAGALNEDIWRGNRAFMGQALNEDIGLFKQWRASQEAHSSAFNEMLESLTTGDQ